jgi:hypothetical protein
MGSGDDLTTFLLLAVVAVLILLVGLTYNLNKTNDKEQN